MLVHPAGSINVQPTHTGHEACRPDMNTTNLDTSRTRLDAGEGNCAHLRLIFSICTNAGHERKYAAHP
ncbi:hypothetical protein BJ994_002996 [Arthrobacter pigmenti]|uniref:Uncharacterized protein n=1 Tax=Arthrobacter pigmenti TaxID=271432 RepID=A0A846RQT7_9MICC|nr:hypothetical protein [Arthrobacter pigmenti]